MNLRFTLAFILSAVFAVMPARALTAVARADFDNTSGDAPVNALNAGVIIAIQGSVAPTNSASSDGIYRLTESSFGQPFSPFQPRTGSLGNPTYAAEVVADVRSKLYPPKGANRSQVLNSGAAFRYKWLLFSPQPGEDDVTSHFQNMTNWYGEPERALASQQIAVLRDALAVSPLDTGLRDALLECYYDLAVAEMQFSKQSLATLAAIHLGLTVTSPFVIDDEIKIYEQLITLEAGVLAKYSELLSLTVDGVDPSSFDDREAPGKPMGLYTFVHQQPFRNAIASEYATDTGTEVIPDFDAATHTAIPRTAENLVLFSGYKDYVTVLQILGNYIAHNSELARLRGMRQGPNDLTKARNAITQILSQTATDYHLLRGLISLNFPHGDASGVNAAINGVDSALADISNVRAFINGTANVLGLDSNFLLLVQGANLPNGYNNESFDVLYALLRDKNQPLGDALNKLQAAVTEYQTFRASVDRVVQSLSDVNGTYASRFVQITGYGIDETPGFDGVNPKPAITSDLLTARMNLDSLLQRGATLTNLLHQFDLDLTNAENAVNLANQLNAKVDVATNNYYNTTIPLYDDLITWNTASATTQAATEAIYSIADSDDIAGIVVAGAAGIANETVQGIAASVTTQRDRDIDYASVNFQASLQKADNALTVNQAVQQLGEIHREVLSTQLELTDNLLSITQAKAQILALYAELNRIAANQQSDSETIRKSYYADPIHYVRSQNALILADSAFRNAQRWIFYTERALEYKWQQSFARSEVSAQGVRSFDSGTVFKLENALELDDLLTQLKAFNDDRLLQDIGNDHTTFISLKNDVLAPNPNLLNATPALRVENGIRLDLETGETVSQLELFRRKLARAVDGAGNISIPVNTVNLAGLNGSFFVGPNYSGATVAPGEWRDKIVYIKVNIVAEDGTSIPRALGGSLSYGGQMFFRTRMPPCRDRNYQFSQAATNDIPGEFFTAPFRFYFSAQYDNSFSSRDFQTASISVAYTGTTAVSPTGEEILGSTYQINDFNQRSVATSSLTLTLFAGQVDIQKIKDIELIVRHHSSARIAPICN